VEDRFVFMGGLTASALPLASPVAAGILGAPFLFSFKGGVEMRWGTNQMGPGAQPPSRPPSLVPKLGGKSLFEEESAGDAGGASGEEEDAAAGAPTIRFFGDLGGIEEVTCGLSAVPAEQLPSGLIKVEVTINGVAVPALLDTGSPITVLNAAAADAAKLNVPDTPLPAGLSAAVGGDGGDEQQQGKSGGGGGGNPFSGFMKNVQAARAAAAGEYLTIMGSNGQPVVLRRADACDAAALGDADLLATSGDEVNEPAVPVNANANANAELRCYVGDLPGLSALGGLGADAGPAAILGTDFLRRRKRLMLVNGTVLV